MHSPRCNVQFPLHCAVRCIAQCAVMRSMRCIARLFRKGRFSASLLTRSGVKRPLLFWSWGPPPSAKRRCFSASLLTRSVVKRSYLHTIPPLIATCREPRVYDIPDMSSYRSQSTCSVRNGQGSSFSAVDIENYLNGILNTFLKADGSVRAEPAAAIIVINDIVQFIVEY